MQDLYHLDYLNQQLGQEASAMFRHRAYSDARRKMPQKIDFTQIEDPLLSQAGLYASQDVQSPIGSPYAEAHSHPDKPPRSPSTICSGTPPLEADEGSEGEDYETTESESHLILHTQVGCKPCKSRSKPHVCKKLTFWCKGVRFSRKVRHSRA